MRRPVKLPPSPNTAYLLLGANLGPDRAAALANARALLAAHGTVLATSALYETAPWGGPAVAGQPPYLNQAIALFTLLDPFQLLRACQQTETALGRERTPNDSPWQARTLDVDILLFGSIELEFGDDLILPHPRLTQRRFALEPLAEIAPDVLVPGRPRRTVQEWLDACTDHSTVLRLG